MQAKYIFKVVSTGINYPLGDVNLMVPKTRAKTVRLSWSLSGLEIHTSCTSFIVAFDGSEIECRNDMLIPWHETTCCLIKEGHCFAEIIMTLTTDECEWSDFKSHITNEAECFISEIYELNSILHKCTSTANVSLDAYNLITSSIFTLLKYYKDGRVDQSLYNEMNSKWSTLRYLIACRIAACTDDHQVLSDVLKHEIINYILYYHSGH